jgi:hypothetical protein
MLRLGDDMATRVASTSIEARPVGGPTGIPERDLESADFGSSSGYPPGTLRLLAEIALPGSGRLVAGSLSRKEGSESVVAADRVHYAVTRGSICPTPHLLGPKVRSGHSFRSIILSAEHFGGNAYRPSIRNDPMSPLDLENRCYGRSRPLADQSA